MSFGLYVMNKQDVSNFNDMTEEELMQKLSMKTWDDFSILKLPMKEIYDLGKYISFDADLCEKHEPLFSNEAIQKKLSGELLLDIGREGLLTIIEDYRKEVVAYFEMLMKDEPADEEFGGGVTAQEKMLEFIEQKHRSWRLGLVLNTELDSEALTNSWSKEYAIFELVRLLKTIDFEENSLIIHGYYNY